VFTERTSVGLDVHARSVVAAAVDGVTGEVFRARLTPGNDVVLGWVRALPGPSAVVYEAGPTGFGLSRALTTAGIRCEIVAPSKIQGSGHGARQAGSHNRLTCMSVAVGTLPLASGASKLMGFRSSTMSRRTTTIMNLQCTRMDHSRCSDPCEQLIDDQIRYLGTGHCHPCDVESRPEHSRTMTPCLEPWCATNVERGLIM
jgi:hypothetical protein